MKSAIIIEDEKHVSANLISALKDMAPHIHVKAILGSVSESLDYFSGNPQTDIIFSDVQLTDGLSFSIFSEMHINAPIIFITGYDKFILNAFEYNSIDYLLKPVTREDLARALNKYNNLEQHFVQSNGLMQNFFRHFGQPKKTRLIVKKGLEHISLLLEDVVLFFTENKIVYVIDKGGKKYLVDKNLGDLEHELDGKMFFRVNRQYIVNINYIRSFKTYERVKLQIELTISELNYFIVVSQETAPHFRKWISES